MHLFQKHQDLSSFERGGKTVCPPPLHICHWYSVLQYKTYNNVHRVYAIVFNFDPINYLSQWTALVVGLEKVATCKVVEDLVLLWLTPRKRRSVLLFVKCSIIAAEVL